MYEELKEQARQAAEELLEAGHVKEGQILVVGCSSSEICGDKIGTHSSLEVGEAVFLGIYGAAQARGLLLRRRAFQRRAAIAAKAAALGQRSTTAGAAGRAFHFPAAEVTEAGVIGQRRAAETTIEHGKDLPLAVAVYSIPAAAPAVNTAAEKRLTAGRTHFIVKGVLNRKTAARRKAERRARKTIRKQKIVK